MSWMWFLVMPASGLVTAWGLRAAGVPGRSAVWSGVAAGLVTGVALMALALTSFDECLKETGSPRPLSWTWSPRHQFCTDGSLPAIGGLALLLIPTAVVMLGTFLRSKGRRLLGWTTYAALLVTPALPPLYVNALPYYRTDSYPILAQPLLRPANGSQPPRVCYVYGIVDGPRRVTVTPATIHECVDLEPTPEALSLTTGYDQGHTSYQLEWMGKELTQKGLPIRPGDTGIDGLAVKRAYRLPDSAASLGATLVD